MIVMMYRPSNPPNFRAVFEEYLILLKGLQLHAVHDLVGVVNTKQQLFWSSFNWTSFCSYLLSDAVWHLFVL